MHKNFYEGLPKPRVVRSNRTRGIIIYTAITGLRPSFQSQEIIPGQVGLTRAKGLFAFTRLHGCQ
jgi:hypothetical protein